MRGVLEGHAQKISENNTFNTFLNYDIYCGVICLWFEIWTSTIYPFFFFFFNPAFMMEWFAMAMVMSIYVKILIAVIVTPTSLEVSRNDNLTLEVI